VSPAESRLGKWRAAYPAFRPKDGIHAGLSYLAPTALERGTYSLNCHHCKCVYPIQDGLIMLESYATIEQI
jgi:uncharacterized protein YbaR (Trm112 family)